MKEFAERARSSFGTGAGAPRAASYVSRIVSASTTSRGPGFPGPLGIAVARGTAKPLLAVVTVAS